MRIGNGEQPPAEGLPESATNSEWHRSGSTSEVQLSDGTTDIWTRTANDPEDTSGFMPADF